MSDLFEKKGVFSEGGGFQKDLPAREDFPPSPSPITSHHFPTDVDLDLSDLATFKAPRWDEVRLDKRIEPLVQPLENHPHNYIPSQVSTGEVLSHLACPDWFEGRNNKAKLEAGRFSQSLVPDPARPGNVLMFRGSVMAHLDTGVYSTFFLKFGAEGLLEKIETEEKLSHELENHSSASGYPLDPFVSVANEPMTACQFGVGSQRCVMVISVPIERMVIGRWNGADREYESYIVGGVAPWEIVGTINPDELVAHGLPENRFYYTAPETTEILNKLLPSWRDSVQPEQPGYISPSEIKHSIETQRDLWAKSAPLFGGGSLKNAPLSEAEHEFLRNFECCWDHNDLPAARLNFEKCVITVVTGDPRTRHSFESASAGYFVELKSL